MAMTSYIIHCVFYRAAVGGELRIQVGRLGARILPPPGEGWGPSARVLIRVRLLPWRYPVDWNARRGRQGCQIIRANIRCLVKRRNGRIKRAHIKGSMAKIIERLDEIRFQPERSTKSRHGIFELL